MIERRTSNETGSDVRSLRFISAVAVVLALGCVALAVAWREKADEADCWRQALEDDETIAAVDCGPANPRRHLSPIRP